MNSRFDLSQGISLADLPEETWLWLAKVTGAVLGSAISIAYVLPKGRREAAIRFVTGVMMGIAFGQVAGAKLAEHLGVSASLSRVEISLMGAAAASLTAWWALGVLRRFLKSRFPQERN